jgi:DNA-binding transcriptional MerR regulator
MVSDSERFDLGELSAAAGVTPRTVRYYVQQGLLPAPATRGPGTRYDGAYLDRLLLIRRLQRQHLPLAEIRKRIESLDDSSVHDALANSSEPSDSSALQYVREVLGRQSDERDADSGVRANPAHSHTTPSAPPPAEAPSQSMFGAVFSRVRAAPPPRQVAVPSTVQPSRSTRSTWERIPLAPDVELHVRRPLSREQNRQVERLLEAARDLFAEEP